MRIESADYEGLVKEWSHQQFEAFSASKGFSLPKADFCFVMKNEKQVLIALAKGSVQAGWLHLNELITDEKHRGSGFGSELLKYVEQHAKENKCIGITINTLGFQAPDFYKNHGYAEFARIEPFATTSKIFFKKQF